MSERHDKAVREIEREHILALIEEEDLDREEARRLVRTGEQDVSWCDGYSQAIGDVVRAIRADAAERGEGLG